MIDRQPPAPGSAAEVFASFLKLGLTSFGGPIAHIGYYRREFVETRRWISDSQFAQLLAICQFLPGPASSQFGFGLGLLRAGWAGALAAFAAFSLPSALLMFALAAWLPRLSGPAGMAAIHGLKIVALAVVSHGLLGMIRQLCPDPVRATIAAISAAVILGTGQVWIQILMVVFGALAGYGACREVPPAQSGDLHPPYGLRWGIALLCLFFVLLAGLPLAARGGDGLLAVIEAFYRSGALVFGGGHVVLPLLEETVVGPGWISTGDFLAGYGAAQALPGPLFTLAAFLGASLPGNTGGVLGATLALGAIFLPGFLLLAGVLPLWKAIAGRPQAARVIAGINAAVVGLLGAALYDPVWISAVRGPIDVAIALGAFTLLAAWRLPPLLVVIFCVAGTLASTLL